MKKGATTTTEEIADGVRDADVEVVTDVRQGAPADVLLEYSNEHDIDLVTMGTAGRSGFTRYVLGSTTERVLRQSEVPVLAAKTGAQLEPDSER